MFRLRIMRRNSRAHEVNVLIQRLPLDSDIKDLMIEAIYVNKVPFCLAKGR